MAITNLTGYTWVGNNTITVNENYWYDIDFISNGNDYTHFVVEILGPPEFAYILAYRNGAEQTVAYDDSNSMWTNVNYKTVLFTGGTDVTNTTLITWLENNGTLTAPAPAGTNNVSIGTLKLAKAFVSNNEIASMWLGNVKIYEKGETPSEYSVTFTASGGWAFAIAGSVKIYDGQDNTGTLLLNQTPANKSAFPMTLQVSSGYCAVYLDGPGIIENSSSQDFNISYGEYAILFVIGPINKNGSVDISVEDFDY